MEVKRIRHINIMDGRVKRTPVVMQMENLECGAACLAMILAYYGKWKPLEEVRTDCGVSRDGSNAANMVLAARGYGMKAGGFRYSTERLKEKAPFPCIIYWNDNHFVVLNGFRKNKALITDPASGARTVTPEEFEQSYSGIALTFAPDSEFVADGSRKSVWSFAKKRLSGTGRLFVFLIITGLLTTMVGVIYPVFGRIFMDRLLTGTNPEWLLPFVFLMSGVIVFQFVVALLNAVYLLKIRGKFAIEANASFIWHVLRLPITFFSQRNIGDISSRQGANESVASTLINSLTPQFLNVLMLGFYLIIMLNYSIPLTAIGVGCALMNIVFANIISRQRVNMTRVTMRDSANLASASMSGIGMIETMKAGGGEAGFFKRWSGIQADLNESRIRFLKKNLYLSSIPSLLNGLASTAVLISGTTLIMQGEFTIGTLTAFQGFLSAFLSPVNSLIGMGQTVTVMRSSMERIEDVMEYPHDVVFDQSADTGRTLSGGLDLHNIDFGYSCLAEPLIRDFSIHISPGGSVAFVGSSGCGKSTLAKLICGLYQPWRGELLFDGRPASDYSRETMTSALAVVSQDIVLFEDTIENNIKMWDSTVSDKDMIQAAIDAGIHGDILQRPGGYQHVIREGGRNFSGGQRQRFEIARALAQNPEIIILDEATSALDAVTEYSVMEAIRRRNITCIIIAHRLSTIRQCEEIVVMDKGIVKERGTHDELFRQDGLYKKLVSME